MIVSSALMIWKGLMVVTGSESPIVVVLSGSMEPAFHRGDLLFLTNYPEEPVRVGEIVVFKVDGRDIPIVHRVLKLHEKYVPRLLLKIKNFIYYFYKKMFSLGYRYTTSLSNLDILLAIQNLLKLTLNC